MKSKKISDFKVGPIRKVCSCGRVVTEDAKVIGIQRGRIPLILFNCECGSTLGLRLPEQDRRHV